jgi:hypothetical protein
MLSMVVMTPACRGIESDTRPPDDAAPSSIHASWARVLEKFHHDGGLNYAALAGDRSDLNTYLARLSTQSLEGWSKDEELAFWVNAYNAVAAHLVIERYPAIESVKDVDGIFDEITSPVAGEELTLDEIESRARKFGDPRVHFAVVCASESCPDLQSRPFEAATLNQQFESALDEFLENPTKGMRFDASTKTLWLSSIFKWYAGDFTGGSTVVAFFAPGGVVKWVVKNLPPESGRLIEESDPKVRYMDYDWTLNNRHSSS